MTVRYWQIPEGAIRVPLPDTSQDEDSTCGAYSLLSILIYFGVGPVEEREVVKDMGMNLRYGSHPFQVVKAAKKHGLEVGVPIATEKKTTSFLRIRYHLD